VEYTSCEDPPATSAIHTSALWPGLSVLGAIVESSSVVSDGS
jgi:hypothetical protein